ncbi:hypothetical protein FB99_25770 [Pantoea agglomerans]|nr:hypothetical protein FB99_25770 [Pantoea agglomerans]
MLDQVARAKLPFAKVLDKLSPFRNLNNFSSQVVSQRADNVSDNLQGEK